MGSFPTVHILWRNWSAWDTDHNRMRTIWEDADGSPFRESLILKFDHPWKPARRTLLRDSGKARNAGFRAGRG